MDDWVKLVRDSSMLRKIATASREIESSAMERGADVNQVLDNAQQKIYELSNNRDSNEFVTMHEALMQSLSHIELLKTDPETAKGIPTGFSTVDEVIVGLGKGDLVFIGARPGMGKTSFAMNIAANVAKSTGKAVAIFSLEMSAEQLATRMLASEALVDSYNLRSGKLTTDDQTQIGYAAAQLSKTNIYIDDTSGITVMQMKSKLRRLHNLGLVIVDYLQLVTGDRRTENRVVEVSEITRNLKIMAKDLGVPIICAAQLSRSNEKRGSSDKKPMLSDLRESGSIEQDADLVMFLYSDSYYDKDKVNPEKANIVQCIIAKNRHGSIKTVDLAWSPQYTKFSSIASNVSEND
jgi:replicative DNA helicase